MPLNLLEPTKSKERMLRQTYERFFRIFKEAFGCLGEEIKPKCTSQTCPRCGQIGKENWIEYVQFKCVKCGYEADKDRMASLNISLRRLKK